MSYEYWIPEFDSKNLGLAELAAEAAVDISNVRLGEGMHEAPAKYLSQLLNDLTQGEDSREKIERNLFVLAYAISGRDNPQKYWGGEKHYSRDELPLQINLVAKDLRDFKDLSGEKQERLETFCVNLSKECINRRRECGLGRSRLVA